MNDKIYVSIFYLFKVIKLTFSPPARDPSPRPTYTGIRVLGLLIPPTSRPTYTTDFKVFLTKVNNFYVIFASKNVLNLKL